MIVQMARPGDRHGDLHGYARQAEGGADADEVGDADAEVRDQDGGRGDHRPADAVLLTDELGQALAGDDAHARGEHLHDRERDRDQQDRPQQAVAVLGAHRGVGGDSAGVVAGVGGDQAGAEQPQEDEQSCASRTEAGRQARPATDGRAGATHDGRYSDRHRTVRWGRSRPAVYARMVREGRAGWVLAGRISPRRAGRSAGASRGGASPRARRRP